MAAPRQMTVHTLEGVKGWPNPHAVDFVAKLSPNVTIDPVFAGRVVHLNAVGDYEMGCPNVAAASKKVNMPIFLFNNSDDSDVQNDGGDAAVDPGVWIAVSPTGKMMGLPAAGAYEFESTEFEPVATAGVYEPGHTLQAIADNANAVTGGRITKGQKYAQQLIGIVSRGSFLNCHGRQALAFWPFVLPATA